MSEGDRALTGEERRLLFLLGLPTFGLALAITVVSTYLPVLARTFSSSTTIIGLLIGAEGIMALWIPLVAGAWSDRLQRRYRRLPFVVAAAPFVVLSLAVLGFAPSLLVVGLLVAVFFAAYFVAYEPYRALYPDLLGEEIASRSQGSQAVWRGGGTLAAMVGGGLLFSVTKFLPFLVAGGLLAVALGAFSLGVVRFGPRPRHEPPDEGGTGAGTAVRQATREVWSLLRRQRSLRLFLGANALWELSLAALKTFVVLYIVRGLGHTVSFASGAVGAVAVFVLLGAIMSGRFGDRLGPARVMEMALWLYGLGLLIPFLCSRWPVVVAAASPLVGFGGGVLMTLPFALLMPLMPTGHHGAVTGYYSVSRGIGVVLGPILAGGAISLLQPLFGETDGYAAMWGVCALAILLSIPLLRRLRSAAAQEERRS